MNIQMQLCGLFMLALLFIFYKSSKTLHLYKEKIFYRAMCIIMLSLGLDILSLVAIYYRHFLPEPFIEFVCKSYLVSLIWGSWSALGYVITDLFTEQKHKMATRYLLFLTLLQSAIVFLLPIHIFAKGKQTFTYGLSVTCVYVFVFLYILSTLFSAIAFSKKMNPRRSFAVIIWMIIWLSSALIQFFKNNLLIVGFASAIGLLILFVVMENPDANLDRRLGCFNSYALTVYIKQLLEHKNTFHLLELSFENPKQLEEYGNEYYTLMRNLLRLLNAYDDILVFQNIQSGLVLICSNKDSLNAAGTQLLESFSSFVPFQDQMRLILVEHADIFSNMDDIFHFLSFVHTSHPYTNGEIFLTAEDIITRYKEQGVIQQEISDALAEDRVEVFFQPIFSNQEKCFTSAEALIRIRKTDGTLLSPGIFIPVAERSGQILELGERVIEKVCIFLKNSDAIKLGIHYIEVNLSIIQCEKKNLAKKLISVVEKYDIDPRLINLEITETASISARTVLLENMKTLIKHGFTFSLDDFGKGESNLMYIVEMPVSIVKLDYDMSKAFFQSSKARHVVRAVVNMAHSMNLKLVAEGIETKEELQSMGRENIDYIQGYYYSRPIPADQFLEFLKKNHTPSVYASK
ncbi:MAG: EAL domain-containing protein [Eubacterium sp.]